MELQLNQSRLAFVLDNMSEDFRGDSSCSVSECGHIDCLIEGIQNEISSLNRLKDRQKEIIESTEKVWHAYADHVDCIAKRLQTDIFTLIRRTKELKTFQESLIQQKKEQKQAILFYDGVHSAIASLSNRDTRSYDVEFGRAQGYAQACVTFAEMTSKQ